MKKKANVLVFLDSPEFLFPHVLPLIGGYQLISSIHHLLLKGETVFANIYPFVTIGVNDRSLKQSNLTLTSNMNNKQC